MRLTAAEKANGFKVFACPIHGDLVVAPPTVVVFCPCGKKAKAK